MRIGELSRRTALSRDTIRYYEKRGLIQADPPPSDFNNYKDYPEAAFRRLMLIKQSKAFGFSLKEIGELLDLMDTNQASCQTLEARVKKKLLDLEEQIQALRQMQQLIRQKAARATQLCQIEPSGTNCPTFTSFGKS